MKSNVREAISEQRDHHTTYKIAPWFTIKIHRARFYTGDVSSRLSHYKLILLRYGKLQLAGFYRSYL